jgi:putative transposase
MARPGCTWSCVAVVGSRWGRKRVARLMAANGLGGRCGRLPGPKTTRRQPESEPPVADLVGRNFDPAHPDQVWCGDITYVRTWEGWLYVAAVIDLHSRAIVGWAMADHMRAELVCEATKMAIDRRRPPAGLIFHSDRGSQYLSAAHRQLLAAYEVAQSVGEVGACWDNAVAESFWATLKCELVYTRSFPTRQDAAVEIFNYIEGFVRHECRGLCNVGDCVTDCNAVQEMEVWPSGVAVQGEAPNYRKLRRLRAGVVSVAEKARGRACQV